MGGRWQTSPIGRNRRTKGVLDMQRKDKRGDEGMKRKTGETGGSHSGRGEERTGGYGDRRCAAAGESLVRSGSTQPEPGAGNGADRRISGHAQSHTESRDTLRRFAKRPDGQEAMTGGMKRREKEKNGQLRGEKRRAPGWEIDQARMVRYGDMLARDGPCDGSQRESKKGRVFRAKTNLFTTEDR